MWCQKDGITLVSIVILGLIFKTVFLTDGQDVVLMIVANLSTPDFPCMVWHKARNTSRAAGRN